jgi:hypothetical protein
MARTGTSTIIKASRTICRMVAVYGANDLALVTTPAMAAAVTALVVACQAFEALDDQPGEIDNVAPLRPGEDGPPL